MPKDSLRHLIAHGGTLMQCPFKFSVNFGHKPLLVLLKEKYHGKQVLD